jgi:hypothetical protein
VKKFSNEKWKMFQLSIVFMFMTTVSAAQFSFRKRRAGFFEWNWQKELRFALEKKVKEYKATQNYDCFQMHTVL